MAQEQNPVIPLGTIVRPYGEIVMVGSLPDVVRALTGHSLRERYYWMKATDGSISMMPANIIEPMVAEAQKKRKKKC